MEVRGATLELVTNDSFAVGVAEFRIRAGTREGSHQVKIGWMERDVGEFTLSFDGPGQNLLVTIGSGTGVNTTSIQPHAGFSASEWHTYRLQTEPLRVILDGTYDLQPSGDLPSGPLPFVVSITGNNKLQVDYVWVAR